MWIVASTSSWGMFAIGLILLTSILLRRSYRYYRRNRRETSIPRRSVREPSRESPLSDAPPEILRWQVEMHETARDLKGELDSKMGALQALIHLAREQTQVLEVALERAEQLGACGNANVLARIEELSTNAAANPNTQLDQLPAVPDASIGAIKPAECRQTIYRLADQGLASEAIAAQVNATVGEVEMILNLRSTQRS